ncbi:MAG: molybdate ABC transporter substrate-binding protein [Sphingomonas sp.]
MMTRFLALLAALLLIGGAPPQRPPLVLAASSLQESMTAAADAWAAKGNVRPVISFAASSALARQAAAGAPADLFVSADEEWMDDLQRRGLIVPGTRATLLGNRLVLDRGARRYARRAARAGNAAGGDAGAGAAGDGGPRFGPRRALRQGGARAAGGVGAGRAAGVRAENVRAALALVERGAAKYGIVYATDARASGKVRVAGVFPPGSHPPIRYPLARLKASTSPGAEGFRRFLLSRRGQGGVPRDTGS